MAKFELEKLTTYDDGSLIGELKRVAGLIHGKLKITDFDHLSKVSSSTLRRRFGDWRKALAAAGLDERFDDSAEAYTREHVIEQLQSIARHSGRKNVTKQELRQHSGISDRPIRRLFGSYRAALDAAGLSQSPGGVRHTDEECFENLLTVWTALGRQPFHSDMKRSPSQVGPKAYVLRWGTWRKALHAFVERANQDAPSSMQTHSDEASKSITPSPGKRSPRDIPLGLRYLVLMRDGNRCPLCGRSPQSEPPAEIHIDHIRPWALGGETVLENLRVLCRECNLGKGARSDEI